jgi:hypothetical protein
MGEFVRASQLYDVQTSERSEWDWPRAGWRVDAFTRSASGDSDLKLVAPTTGAWISAAESWEVVR